jgi:hypothetical protein
MPIKTNHVPRDVIDDYELSADERTEFDYIDWKGVDAGTESAQFFRYRGTLYDIGEFTATFGLPASSPFHEWDGYMTDSFFSGLVVKYVDQYERVIVGLWLE